MAHESFENPQIAALMNELFVNIKVDREERPDLDAIYQHALASDGRAGRLAADDVSDPGGRAVLGRHLFPAGAALGPARLSAGPGVDRAPPIAQDATRSRRMSRRCARRCSSSASPRARRRRIGIRPNCSTASPSGCCARSIRSTAASARRRNSRNAGSSNCCGAPGSAPGRRPTAMP